MSPMKSVTLHLVTASRTSGQGKGTLMRRWIRALEEERKILAMIERVEVFNASNEQIEAGSVKTWL
jgi:hypothetical protein